MSVCRDCQRKIIWCEREDGKKVSIDSKPDDKGQLETIGRHPELPLLVRVNPRAKTRFIEHFKTCPNSTYQEREPSWVREPEGY